MEPVSPFPPSKILLTPLAQKKSKVDCADKFLESKNSGTTSVNLLSDRSSELMQIPREVDGDHAGQGAERNASGEVVVLQRQVVHGWHVANRSQLTRQLVLPEVKNRQLREAGEGAQITLHSVTRQVDGLDSRTVEAGERIYAPREQVLSQEQHAERLKSAQSVQNVACYEIVSEGNEFQLFCFEKIRRYTIEPIAIRTDVSQIEKKSYARRNRARQIPLIQIDPPHGRGCAYAFTFYSSPVTGVRLYTPIVQNHLVLRNSEKLLSNFQHCLNIGCDARLLPVGWDHKLTQEHDHETWYKFHHSSLQAATSTLGHFCLACYKQTVQTICMKPRTGQTELEVGPYVHIYASLIVPPFGLTPLLQHLTVLELFAMSIIVGAAYIPSPRPHVHASPLGPSLIREPGDCKPCERSTFLAPLENDFAPCAALRNVYSAENRALCRRRSEASQA
ncbi:hypothetical protein Mapa_004058 [Marchantia paleacea]|nr:hypothetical protein Mapa_004058 [Marchantia paleacea]